MAEEKEKVYRQIKIIGFALYLPVIMVTPPLTGNFLGEYLKNKYGTGNIVPIFCITLGFLVSFIETARVIRLISKMNRD